MEFAANASGAHNVVAKCNCSAHADAGCNTNDNLRQQHNVVVEISCTRAAGGGHVVMCQRACIRDQCHNADDAVLQQIQDLVETYDAHQKRLKVHDDFSVTWKQNNIKKH